MMEQLEQHIKETVAILQREPLKPPELRKARAALEALEDMGDSWLGGDGAEVGPVWWAIRYLRAATDDQWDALHERYQASRQLWREAVDMRERIRLARPRDDAHRAKLQAAWLHAGSRICRRSRAADRLWQIIRNED